MRCDYIAEGVIKASKELNLDIPLIVRLKGTKEAEAKQYVIFLLFFLVGWKLRHWFEIGKLVVLCIEEIVVAWSCWDPNPTLNY